MIACKISETLYQLIIDIITEQKPGKTEDLFENYGAWIVQYKSVRIFLKNNKGYTSDFKEKKYLMDINKDIIAFKKVNKKGNDSELIVIPMNNISFIEFFDERDINEKE